MKVTEKQLLIMIRVLEGSLRFCDNEESDKIFGYVRELRHKVYNEIMNQTSDEIVEISIMECKND